MQILCDPISLQLHENLDKLYNPNAKEKYQMEKHSYLSRKKFNMQANNVYGIMIQFILVYFKTGVLRLCSADCVAIYSPKSCFLSNTEVFRSVCEEIHGYSFSLWYHIVYVWLNAKET